MSNRKDKIICLLKSFISTILFIHLSITSFGMTGSVFKPLLICLLGSLIICFILTTFRSSERIAANSMLFLMLFWLVFAVVKEIILQIENGFVFNWIYFFYYDKLLMLGAIWLSVSILFCIRRLVSTLVSDIEYSYFFKINLIAFLIFYVFLIIYSFVLIRLQPSEYPFNFKPFTTIKGYISEYSSIPYEIFMMFFGNLLYFTPLGYIFAGLLRNKSNTTKMFVNLFFPLIVFTLLEFSQYIFQNGYCEFDDMMMNTIGFWFGNLIYTLMNKFAEFISRRKYTTFWN